MSIWKDGEVHKLLKEGTVIQERLIKTKPKSDHHEKVFIRLMLQGKVSAALRWNGSKCRSLLEVTPEVSDILKSKHPKATPASYDSILKGPVFEAEEAIFESINADTIHHTAKQISGSAGPSGADAEMWQRILCSKQFKKKPTQLCESIADLAKKLSCKVIDPDSIRAYTACRLIPLAKIPDGVRPIGVGEVLRRIVGKAITMTLKPDIAKSTAPIQVCGGLPGGVEAAIHAVRGIYEDSTTEAVLLVDAENAFNSLNRNSALNNIQYTCPEFFKYVLNTYRQPAELYITNSEEIILSAEGTTQGDTSAMSMYACSLMPLVESLKSDEIKQSWYADDSAAGGALIHLKTWWDNLQQEGPMYGYYPKACKTWLIVKPKFIEQAKALFPDVNITDVGHRHLGSYIGARAGLEVFIKNEIDDWNSDITGLTNTASREPQLAYSAFVYGTSKRWNFVARTTPDISSLLKPLEYKIKEDFIPAIIGKSYLGSDAIRSIFSLPAKMGGLGISDITETSDLEYENSVNATKALTEAIFQQKNTFVSNVQEQHDILESIKKKREEFFKNKRNELHNNLSDSQIRQLELLSEKGASSWLTSLPLKEYGFLLNKQEFHDAIALRYNFTLGSRARLCVCGENNTINHCLICKKGGYVALRHNSLRNTTAELLQQVCNDVMTEPTLLPINGEQLPPGTNVSDGARLDVSARSFWTPLDRAFTDIRVLHPQAPSNSNKSLKQMYHSHELEKKRFYNGRVLQVEKASFTPLVFSTSGGMGTEAALFFKRLAEKISMKTNQKYSDVITFIRRRLRFDLLKTCLISLRGYRGKTNLHPEKLEDLDLNLRPQAIY